MEEGLRDESVAPPSGDTPSPALSLAEGGLGGPHSTQGAVLGSPVTHQLLHQAEVHHCYNNVTEFTINIFIIM